MTPPATSPICIRCDTPISVDAPEKLCPRCLLALFYETQALEKDRVSPLPSPDIEELAKEFPQLDILENLGRGGMGVVYKARQKSLNREVALKLLAPERAHDPEFAKRFQKEAQALAALNHPNIVTIHDFGKTESYYFLLMEFVDGVNLRQAMRTGQFTPSQALAIVPPVCEALQFAHERKIIHRDIKPENILLDVSGHIKIADFGIARILEDEQIEQPLSDTSESKGTLLGGTPHYMAPEQSNNSGEADHRVDIYAMGVVLYELLTGEPPSADLSSPSKKIQIDIRIDDIVLKALNSEPKLRYQTAHQFSTVVQTLSEQLPGSTKTSQPQASPSDGLSNRPAQSWRQWFPIPWAIERNGLIKPNWLFIFIFCPICLFIIWGGINAFFIKPWDSTLTNNNIRFAGTLLIILWSFLSYRHARTRLLNKKRLLGLGEKPDHWYLHWTQNLAIAITIAMLIRSFYMSFYVRTDRMSPQLEKGSIAIVQRINRHFSQGEIIAYKEGKKDFFGLVAEMRTVNSSAKILLVTDHRGKEFNVPIQNVYGRVKFDNSRAKVDQLPKPSQGLSHTNHDQDLSTITEEELRQQDVKRINHNSSSATQPEEMNIQDITKKATTAVIATTMAASAIADELKPVDDAARAALKEKARERMRQDRNEYSRQELAELEELYQVANKSWKTDKAKAKEAMEKLVKTYQKANRTGCAMLYLGQLSRGDERDKYLDQAIRDHSDCYYGNGVQVGGWARYLRIHDLRSDNDHAAASQLEKEIHFDYEDAINHGGILITDLLQREKLDEDSVIEQLPAAKKLIAQKLATIIIPEFSLEDATISEAIQALSHQIRIHDKDPKQQGINILLEDAPNNRERLAKQKATLKLSNISAKVILEYLVSSWNLTYRIDETAVVITSKGKKTSKETHNKKADPFAAQ